MILGTYALPWDPDRWTMPEPKQRVLEQDTYSSNILFFYGEKVVGTRIELEWEWMSQAQFDALDVLYQADLPVVWNLQEPTDPRTFMVEIEKFDGSLFDVALWDLSHRKDVKMSLIILSEVSLS